MPEFAVIAPPGFAAGLNSKQVTLLEFTRWDEARAALMGSYDGAVLVTDGIPPDRFPVLAGAVRSAGYPVIEFRSGKWDGVEHSTLSAACEGAISGFGPDGLRAALKALGL